MKSLDKSVLVSIAGLFGATGLSGCSIDDRQLIETDENGTPIAGDGDGDGSGGTGGTGTGGTDGSGGGSSNPGETCGDGNGWITDSIGTVLDLSGDVLWRGDVFAQKSGELSDISPTTFDDEPACVSGTVEPTWWAALRFNLAQEYADDCVPAAPGSIPLVGDGITFTGSTDVGLRVTVTAGVQGSADYWCYLVPPDDINAGPVSVTWDQLTKSCDSGPSGAPYAGEDISTLQFEPSPGADGDFEFCVETLEVD